MLGKLKHLVYLDVSKNNLEMVDEQICSCESLQDLLLSNNTLTQLPGSIGKGSSIDNLYRKMIQIFICILPLLFAGFFFIILIDCIVITV